MKKLIESKRFLIGIIIFAIALLSIPNLLSFTLKLVHPIIAEREEVFKKATYLTAKLAITSGLIGIVIGFLIAIFGLHSKSRFRAISARAYIWIFCGTPLLTQILFVYYGIPYFFSSIKFDEFQAGVFALSLNSAAYNSTVIKSGLDSVPKQQYESGLSLGLNHVQILRWIILPQAMKISVPPLLNNWAALIKDTSLVSAIGVAELTLTASRTNSETFSPVPTLITVALIYLSMSTLVNVAVYLQKKAKSFR
jgi:polar amino acid transport system permease protein